MRQLVLLVIVVFITTITGFGQIRFTESYKQALELAKKHDKKIFIDFYTFW